MMRAPCSFLVILLVTSTGYVVETQPTGHLLPLGSHQPAESPGVDVLHAAPSPEDFYREYVEASRPFVLKNHARDMPAFKYWTDQYLRSTYGHIKVDVEQGKKENRSNSLWVIPLSEFLDRYNDSDMYMVHSLPKEMMGDIWLIKSLLCGGFTSNIIDAVTWFSSGGTKSVIHFDALDNINCLFDGSKELILFPRSHSEKFNLKSRGSYSTADVDRIDLIKYPEFANVPWYNVTMQPGDCLYIPYRWAHSVRSWGRNLAINIWFVHMHKFDYEDCLVKGQLPEFAPLSSHGISAENEDQMRGEMIDFIKYNGGSIGQEDMQAAVKYFGATEKDLSVIFDFMDTNRDGKVVVREVEKINYESFKKLVEVLEASGDDDEEDDDDDDGGEEEPAENINEITSKEPKSHLDTNKSEL